MSVVFMSANLDLGVSGPFGALPLDFVNRTVKCDLIGGPVAPEGLHPRLLWPAPKQSNSHCEDRQGTGHVIVSVIMAALTCGAVDKPQA